MARGIIEGVGGTGFPAGWKEKASGEVFGGAIAKNDPVVLGRYGSWDTAIDKIPDISGLGGTGTKKVDFYGDYMAISETGSATPEVYIFKRTGVNDGFKLLSTPSVVNGVVYVPAFSNDGNFLAIGRDSAPYFKIFSRSGDVFTLLSTPATMPTDRVIDLEFSSSGTYLAVTTDTTAVFIYKKNGTNYEYLTSITAGVGVTSGVSFSSDETYLAITGATSSYIKVFKRSGDTFTALSNPTILPTGAAYGGCAFSPDGNYLAVLHLTTPWVTIYKRSGDVFTKLANPSILPGINVGQYSSNIEFDPSSSFLAITTYTASPFIMIYSISNDVFAKLPNPSTIPSSTVGGCAFSDDGLYIAVGIDSSPYSIIYRTQTKGIVSKISHFQTNPLSWLPNNDNIGIAMQGGAIGETIRVNLFPALNNI